MQDCKFDAVIFLCHCVITIRVYICTGKSAELVKVAALGTYVLKMLLKMIIPLLLLLYTMLLIIPSTLRKVQYFNMKLVG